MNNETFNKNLETIFDEIDMNELEPNLDDCLKDEDLAKKIYNLISSKFCNKFNFSSKDFDKQYINLYESGDLFRYVGKSKNNFK